ncbi:Flp pilus assembly protein CpaB [Sphingomicrobium flavum]|uniref:Flp pilus assembly protein CpaB n=1 Tax=Sphingomicrobium flavum TaxID=1229164 RepID=UPI0021AD666E|nr:Flp pilus assembly protein CpaB [Sphingomicrobium flavum]
MNGKKIILLVGALVIAAVAAILAKNLYTGAGAQQANAAPVVPAGPKVLVAKKPLPVGTIIDAEALSFQAWPQELVQGAYYTEGGEDADPSQLIGRVVRNAISAGQPVTRGSLVGPDDRGFLAAALGPGMRAISISVDSTTGVAGFIFPGDRVDLVLSQEIEVEGEGQNLRTSETIVRNLRVLATDQRVTEQKNENGEVLVVQSETVTVEVTPKMAEKIAVARKIGGELSFALRSIADNEAELERAIASGEVDVDDIKDPAEERRILLAIANKPIDTNPTYTTGGQVSRFQRSAMPAPRSATGQARIQGPSSRGSAAPAPAAYNPPPQVRVSRGNNVTTVTVGAR